MRLIGGDRKVSAYIVARISTKFKTIVQNLSLRIRRRRFALLQQGKRTNKTL
jgi:hypothetical protein